tara:strand:+ start:426 stop:647 length:222 start_codon:yes stop_codon:yes gene_type:complete
MDWIVGLFFLPWLALKITISAIFWYMAIAAIRDYVRASKEGLDARGWWYGFKDVAYDIWYDMRQRVRGWFGRR